ncbi:reverse transcriptase [Gossypium australe]|uniref:Reverse transcriptase n=1 Tax=Gossypium australe TaxID=47621 RepID=A0A5B6WIS4_9ROSI|nr:reverse transcriptase [Gossypium australe]
MKIISWNVRGLGNPWAVKRLQHMLRQHNPEIVFLMETKLDGKRIFSINHIDVDVDEDGDGAMWRMIGFYDALAVQGRSGAWNLLKRLGKEQSGLPMEERRMEEFKATLNDYHLEYIGYARRWFTWERGNLSKTNIKECLDRGVENLEWINLFPEYTVRHLSHSFSYHCPLLFQMKPEKVKRKILNFRFEAWWIMEESCEEEVKLLWEQGKGSVVEWLAMLGKGLQS